MEGKLRSIRYIYIGAFDKIYRIFHYDLSKLSIRQFEDFDEIYRSFRYHISNLSRYDIWKISIRYIEYFDTIYRSFPLRYSTPYSSNINIRYILVHIISYTLDIYIPVTDKDHTHLIYIPGTTLCRNVITVWGSYFYTKRSLHFRTEW